MLATLHGGIDQILRIKAPIQIGEILNSHPANTLQCVLVEGAPGVGKTTLAWEACKQWGKGKLFQQFSIVMLLRLRDKTVQNANSITDLIFYRDQHYKEDISQHLQQSNGRDTLIILEGLDELPAHLMQSSIFTHLLSGQELPYATILITSRPSATVHLWKNWRHRVTRHIEVLGFTQENITQYMKSVLAPQQLPGFQTFLSINAHIKTTMYIPLHAAIVIEVYKWCQHPRRPLPETITQLYKYLVNLVLHRYIEDHPDYKGKEIHLQTITDLPPPVYIHFCSLIQLAYTGITQQKLVFQDHEQPIQHLGFMNTVTELFPSFDDHQVSYSYNFLHLSIQEYLAAYYISTMKIHEQEQLLETMCGQIHLQNMGRFLAGITKFKGLDRAIVHKSIEGECRSIEESEGAKATELSMNALHLLYECGDASILDSHRSYVCQVTDYNPLFDLITLGYCITHSNCSWRLELGEILQFIKSTDRVQMLVQALQNHNSSSYNYSIESIVCYYSALACVEQLLTEMPQNILLQLKALQLVSENQQPSPQTLHEIIPSMSSLHTLRLSRVTGAVAVHRTVQAVISANTLNKLTLYESDIDYECVTTLCQWLSTSSHLETLAITPLPSPTAIKLTSIALTTNSTLKSLDLLGSEFNLSAGQDMCAMLSNNNTLTELRLWNCHIDDDIICCVAKGHYNNSTLTILNISLNLIGDRGAESIAQALCSNNALTTLDISDNSISDHGTVCLAKMLKINKTLEEVNLSFNNIRNEGRRSLEEVEETNRHITLHYYSSVQN